MNNKDNNEVMQYIQTLMEESFWGKTSSKDSLKENLQSEVSEFLWAFQHDDIENAKEEASDVFMIMLCILYQLKKDDGEEYVDNILRGVIEKLTRRYGHLYDDSAVFIPPEKELDKWKDSKKIENIRNYMFCDNDSCYYYGDMGDENIVYSNGKFICKGCKKQIRPSKQNVFFLSKKDRKKFFELFATMICKYASGSQNVFLEMQEKYSYLIRCLAKEIDEDKVKERIFCKYINQKYSVDTDIVDDFCKEILILYKTMSKTVEDYYSAIRMGLRDVLEKYDEKDKKNIKLQLGKKTMDVVKRVDTVCRFSSRNWDNQLVNKYLMSYKKSGKDRILEAQIIIHYKGEETKDLTIEISNMYNCVVGCRFCASAALPETVEYLDPIDYVRQINTCVKESGINPDEFKNFFVSFAGIGEPSVVVDNISQGMEMIRDLYPHVKFNIASFGLNLKAFDTLEEEDLPIRTIQIPYYSGNYDTLKGIVENLPRDYSFEAVFSRAMRYQAKHKECRIKVNYLVMKGKNDNKEEMDTLIKLIKNYDTDYSNFSVKVSFLNYTRPGAENDFVSPGKEALLQISEYLSENSVPNYVFGSFANYGTGCGQLAQGHISLEN